MSQSMIVGNGLMPNCAYKLVCSYAFCVDGSTYNSTNDKSYSFTLPASCDFIIIQPVERFSKISSNIYDGGYVTTICYKNNSALYHVDYYDGTSSHWYEYQTIALSNSGSIVTFKNQKDDLDGTMVSLTISQGTIIGYKYI